MGDRIKGPYHKGALVSNREVQLVNLLIQVVDDQGRIPLTVPEIAWGLRKSVQTCRQVMSLLIDSGWVVRVGHNSLVLNTEVVDAWVNSSTVGNQPWL